METWCHEQHAHRRTARLYFVVQVLMGLKTDPVRVQTELGMMSAEYGELLVLTEPRQCCLVIAEQHGSVAS